MTDKIKDGWKAATDGNRQLEFVARLAGAGFDVTEINVILEIIEATCTACWDSDSGCHCENDE